MSVFERTSVKISKGYFNARSFFVLNIKKILAS